MEQKNHPSYASMYIGRGHCSGKQTLFGSSIKHSEVITLRISPASLGRELNSDYIFADAAPYIEIDMSQAQFAQAITSLNMGEGTPVTLRYLNGQRIEPCPFEDKRMQFNDEFSKKLKDINDKFKKMSKEAEILLSDKKPLNKADREKILSAFHKVQIELGSNMPFVYSQFNTQMEKTISEAKAEVESHIQTRLSDLAMHNMSLDKDNSNVEQIKDEYADISDDGMQMGGM